MDLDRIAALLEILERHDVSEFRYQDGDVRLEFRLGAQAVVAPSAPVVVASPAPAAPVTPAAPEPATEDLSVVESPMVGTFYRASAPGAPPFVDVGAQVSVGQPLCIVEAMKLMNEIEAEVTGTVVQVLAQNGEPVQFGQPLFRIRPSA